MENEELQRLVKQAEALCEKRKLEEALTIGEELVSRWPDEMLPYYVRGRARWGTKSYTEALADLDKALEMAPGFAKAWNYRGNTLADIKRYGEALECYDRALGFDPEYIYAYNGKGNVLFNMKRYEEAMEWYDRALKLDPEFALAYNNKGTVLSDLKRYEEALESYDRALGLDLKYANACNGKGNVLEDMKRYEEALECYDRALGFDPELADAYNGKGAVLSDMKRYEEALESYDHALGIDPELAYVFNNKGNVLNSMKRYEEALECYDRALSLDLKLTEAYNNKGNVLIKMKRYEEALECYDHVLGLDLKLTEAYNNKGNVLIKMKRYEEALECYDHVLELDPEYTYAYNGKGNVLAYMKRYDEALECYDRALRLDPKYVNAFNGKGNVLSEMKRYEEALESYDCALGFDPELAHAYNGKGSVLFNMKRYEEALEWYDRALKLDPEFALAYNNKGNVLYDMKRYEEALECYDRALGLDPELADAYNNKGNVLYDMKRYEEALECYDRAIGIDSKLAYAYNGKGNVLLEIMRYDEALENYNVAIELEEDALYFQNRGRLYEAQDRYSEALADYNRCIQMDTDNEYAKFLRGRLLEKNPQIRQSRHTDHLKTEKAEAEEEWKKRAKQAAERFVAEEESSGGFPGGGCANLNDGLTRRIRQFHDNEQQIEIAKEIEEKQKTFKQFIKDQHLPDNLTNQEFYVLRRWNSYTPIVTHNNGSSKGGGYFLHMGASGVVIDPGFNFIENFQEWGFSFSQIGKVFVSHAHNDHDADLESILTLLHVYNDDVKDKIMEILIKEVLNGEYPDKETKTEDAVYQYMKKESVSRYSKERKVIDLYLTAGAFKKHAARLELRRDGEYRVHIVKPGEEPTKLAKDVTIHPICARHFDLMSDCDAVGFVVEFPLFALVYTGDTGFSPEIAERYKILRKRLVRRKKKLVLLAHLGGFKARERNTDTASLSSRKAFYKNHLGRNGLICLTDVLRPQYCIVSEFGEEFDHFREGVADIFTKAFDNLGIPFFPADIGLCINSDAKIWAIVKTRVEGDRSVVVEKAFIDPCDIKAVRLKSGSLTYYHRKLVRDEGDLNRLLDDIERANESGEEQRPKRTPVS